MLKGPEKRKYAQGKQRCELGIWGYSKKLFRSIHLTTREGDNNSCERFVVDFKKLIKWFRQSGYEVEYCGAMGFTPGKGLLHFHGLLRIKGGYFPITRRMLGDRWNEIHGAFAVQIGYVNKYSYFDTYIVKHIMKDYAASHLMRNHFLFSRKWRRVGFEFIIKEVKEWWIEGKNLPWMTSEGWRIVNQVVKAFCEKRPLVVKAGFGHLVMDGKGVIRELEIYGKEVE